MSGVDKSEKYDRQLRLWGVEGQQLLEASNIAILGATATSTEALKNLILPGCGTFTVFDGDKVEENDLGKNFFVTTDSVGKQKAQVTTELLQELNPDVSGNFIAENPITLIEENIQIFDQYTLVIASILPEKSLIKLADYLYEKKIPLIYYQVSGLIASIRIQVEEHQVIESKPMSVNPDLRIVNPWPELLAFCDTFDVHSEDKSHRGHIPYVVLLLKWLQKWRNEHDGAIPLYKETQEFKNSLYASRTEDSDNYNEAFQNARLAWLKPSIPGALTDLFESPKCSALSDNSDFWICVRSLKEFVDKYGDLPLRGSVPDMHTDTVSFLALQNLYQDKAQKDIQEITNIINDILPTTGRVVGSIDSAYIKKFCKNAHFLRLVSTRRISLEYSETPQNEELAMNLEFDPDGFWYLILRGVSRFFSYHNRFPGCQDSDVLPDIPSVKNHVLAIAGEIGANTALIQEDAIHEICRYGGAEIHSVASFIGAIISQEAIKLITHQLVPFNNTFIYNAIKNSGVSLNA